MFVLVAAGKTRLYLKPSQGPQHHLHQDGTDVCGVADMYFQKCGDVAGDRPLNAGSWEELWKGIRPAAGPVSATLSKKTQEELWEKSAK